MIIRYQQDFLLPPLEPCLDVTLVAFRGQRFLTLAVTDGGDAQVFDWFFLLLNSLVVILKI